MKDLEAEYEEDFYLVEADKSKCPKIQWVYRFYYDTFTKKCGGHMYGPKMLASLQAAVTKYNEICESVCAKIKIIDDNNYLIAIITPEMRRFHENVQSSETLFVDSTGTVETTGVKVFLLLANSFAGGLPLGVVITTSESEDRLKDAFSMYKSMLNEKSFNGKGAPSIIMTDDCSAERSALAFVFPNAILLLCIFHVLQTVWRNPWKATTQVPAKDRQPLMILVKYMLRASNVNELNKYFEKVKEMCSSNVSLLEYMQNLYDRREEWALYYRKEKELRLCGQHTNNLAEAGMKVLKDRVLNRLKAYNAVQLFQIIISDFVMHYKRKLISIANGNIPAYLNVKLLKVKKKFNNLCCTSIDGSIFSVVNSATKRKYVVDMVEYFCSCYEGLGGDFCKHIAYVCEMNPDKHHPLQLPLNEENRVKTFVMATGKVPRLRLVCQLDWREREPIL